MKRLALLILVLLLAGCGSRTEDILEKYHCAVSPDKKALVYQASHKEGKIYKIALATWIETSYANGGAGIFDIEVDSPENLKMEWTSDSSIRIIVPEGARIKRQRNESYFSGRVLHISYEREGK